MLTRAVLMAHYDPPDIPEMILPTLQELGLEFSEIDSRAAIQLKEEKRQQCSD
jgi:hypothetical protein